MLGDFLSITGYFGVEWPVIWGYLASQVEKTSRSKAITEFNFKPVDGQPISSYSPGQYTTIWTYPTQGRGWFDSNFLGFMGPHSSCSSIRLIQINPCLHLHLHLHLHIYIYIYVCLQSPKTSSPGRARTSGSRGTTVSSLRRAATTTPSQ